MPTAREGFCVAEIGGRVLAIAGTLLDAPGSPKPATGTVEAWDPATDRWDVVAPMPSARSEAAIAVAAGRVLVFGGRGGTGRADRARRRRGVRSRDGWVDHARPDAVGALGRVGRRARHARVGDRGSAGGFDVATHAVYDATSDAWLHDSVALPSGRRYPTAFAPSGGGQLDPQSIGGYASTGVRNAGFLPRWERRGPGARSWSALPTPPTARARAAAAVSAPALYAIGGSNVDRALQTVEAWNPMTRPWRVRTPLPVPAATPGAALLLDGRIAVIDGRAIWIYVTDEDLA